MAQDVYPDAGLTPGEDDLEVTPQQILSLPFFGGVNAKKLGRCQGAMVLRIFKEAGQPICRQGVVGVSAYFILSEADVYGLFHYLETKLQEAQEKLGTKPTEKLQAHVQTLRNKCNAYRARLLFLADPTWKEKLRAAHEANNALARRSRASAEERRFLTARVKDKREHARKVRETDPELATLLLAAAEVQEDGPAAFVYRHTGSESRATASSAGNAASSSQVTMYEGELFGEMACRNRQPRAADVRAARPLYVLELLSNVLAILEEDKQFQKEVEHTYEQRILELHLRGFSLFRHLPEDQFMEIYDRVRNRFNVLSFNAGTIICEQGVASDTVYLIRRGWVQVRVSQGSEQRILAYRGPGEFIGEMGLIQTEEQTTALEKGDFTGVLRTLPRPGPRTATCVAFGHPDGEGKVELVCIPYEEFGELLQASRGIREEIVTEVKRRQKQTQHPSLLPDIKGSANVLFADPLTPLGLYQGQSLMLIDLDRCTRCNECVKACIDSHSDGRSRLFLQGPSAPIGERRFLVPTTCQSCEDPVCMIGCPTRAIRRGAGGEMIIKEDTCIGCAKCAGNCPYNAIQMHDLGLISAPGNLGLRVAGPKTRQKDEPAESCDWYCFPTREIGVNASAWRTQTSPPQGWLACKLPLLFDHDFRQDLAAHAGRPDGANAISAGEELCFWRALPVPRDRQNWDGQVSLEVKGASEASFKVWIDGQELVPTSGKAKTREYRHQLPASTRKGWRWGRKEDFHVLALEVIANCEPEEEFLHVRLDAVRPPRGPWDILDDVTEKTRKPKLAVVCDLCSTTRGGPACIRACPHDATLRFDAHTGLPSW